MEKMDKIMELDFVLCLVLAFIFVLVLYAIKITCEHFYDFCIKQKRAKNYEEIDGRNSEEAELLTQSIINIPR